MSDHVALAEGWRLWRDVAVRSPGFPIDGLDAFGGADESGRLRALAGHAAFREAMTWQNPAAVEHALNRLDDAPGSHKTRRREDVVASYWQRYCAKNDTIGFFGPLAWGRIVDPPAETLRAHSGALVRERSVHLESWAVQALATSIDPALRVALGPRSEDDLREVLDGNSDAALRERGLAALATLEDGLAAVQGADREQLPRALADLDARFTRLTSVAPTRNHGRAYGARTLAYLDCMRDLDVTLGPGLVEDLSPALVALFEAGRWFCGRIQAVGEAVIDAALGSAAGRVPFASVAGRILGPIMRLPAEIDVEVAELQRRMAALVADPDPATLPARARDAFADHRPAWPCACYQSVDVQVAARDEQAVRDGDHLAVVGDIHPGSNPLLQGVFGHRHPAPSRMYDLLAREAGTQLALLLPPWGPGMQVDARGVPLLGADAVHVAINPESSAPRGRRTWRAEELWIEGGVVVSADGDLRLGLAELFAMPIFVMAVRTFEPWAPAAHQPRLTVGRVVLRRASWSCRAEEVPEDVVAWARDRGMPRRLFVKTPGERKPFYLDLESPVLRRIALRHIRAARGAGEPVRFTEMLPGPQDCWLHDREGRRYASEFRLVGVAGDPSTTAGAAPRRCATTATSSTACSSRPSASCR